MANLNVLLRPSPGLSCCWWGSAARQIRRDCEEMTRRRAKAKVEGERTTHYLSAIIRLLKYIQSCFRWVSVCSLPNLLLIFCRIRETNNAKGNEYKKWRVMKKAHLKPQVALRKEYEKCTHADSKTPINDRNCPVRLPVKSRMCLLMSVQSILTGVFS